MGFVMCTLFKFIVYMFHLHVCILLVFAHPSKQTCIHTYVHTCTHMYIFNPNPLRCVQNRIQIGGFGTVRVNTNCIFLALFLHTDFSVNRCFKLHDSSYVILN